MTNSAITSDLTIANDPAHFVAVEQALGWRLGFWPRSVETTLGDASPFQFERYVWWGHDIVCGIYRQRQTGIELKVFRD